MSSFASQALSVTTSPAAPLSCSRTRPGEAKGIFWGQVDLKGRKIELTALQTKTGKARILPLSSELVSMLKPGDNWWLAFPATNLRKLWPKATKAAGCEGLLFHDLRRSAVRNMMKAGVQQAVAMRLSGHTTDHIFQRYNIIAEDQLHEAMERVEAEIKS
jgi:integrase